MPSNQGIELTADAALASAKRAVALGDALAAVDVLQALPDALHTLASRHLLILSLLRAGALADARGRLRALVEAGHQDEETLGLVAREAKARWQQAHAEADRRAALAEARDAYLRAFQLTQGTWTGVNAATLSLIAGDAGAAEDIARALLPLLDQAPAATQDTFWHCATRGEVALILGDVDGALVEYRRALAKAPRAFGDHRSARDNALAILDAKGLPVATLKGVFPGVGVAVFSGHTIDAPGRDAPRFPTRDEARVAQAIDAALTRHGVEIGVSAAACGADIIFLEALQRAGKETKVVLPHSIDVFRKVSVTDIGGESWGRRFDNVLKHAHDVIILAPHQGEDLAYQFQGAVMAGLAVLRARAVDGHALGIALWDGEVGGVGGTSTVVKEWAQRGLEVELLPCGNEAGGPLLPGRARDMVRDLDLRCASGQRVISILFADAVGFSKLAERQVKAFVYEFWGRVGALLQRSPEGAVLTANTWGDGLFIVFSDALIAATLASDLAEMVTRTDWQPLGLPASTSIRIALHAGPAYETTDPITLRPGFAGMQISRAARIEPVTPPGEVYVSEAFAALLAFDDNLDRFKCEYVGTVPLAKEYGRFRTYKLTRGIGVA